MKKLAPQWIVNNLEETLEFYVDILGFTKDWVGSLFAIVSCGEVSIMLRQLKKQNLKRPNKIPFIESGWHSNDKEAWDAYIWVDDVDGFYASIKEKGVTIIKEVQDTAYGNRDFEIEDNNGYILCFGQTEK